MITPVFILILGIVGASAICDSNYVHQRLVFCMDPMLNVGNHVGDAALHASCNAIQQTAHRLQRLRQECPHNNFIKSVVTDFSEMNEFMMHNFC